MAGLKEQLGNDLKVFFNMGEFAEVHNTDGVDLPVVVDSDVLKTRSNDKTEQYDGVYASKIAVYVRAADLLERPVFGQEMRLDGKLYMVIECTEEMGVLEIVLGANES